MTRKTSGGGYSLLRPSRAASLIILAALLISPTLASASYLPGETLDPHCLPLDAGCVVVASSNSSTTNTAATFSATSTTATSTFAGNVQIAGTASSTNLFSTIATITSALINSLTAATANITTLVASSITGTSATITNLSAQSASIGSLSGAAFSSLASNSIPKWNNGTWSNSLIYDNGTGVGIGTTSPSATFAVNGSGYFANTLTASTANIIGNLNLGSPYTITPESILIDATSSQKIGLKLYKSGIERWELDSLNDLENGSNSGSSFFLGAYTDTGAFSGTLLQAARASGPQGNGVPYLSYLSPYRQGASRAAAPGGVDGNDSEFSAADVEPTISLSANPITTTGGSASVTVYWQGCCGNGGPVATSPQTWVNLQGASAVGGITPSGWLPVQSIVDNNDFTINWTSSASASATGGGSSVTATPSAATTVNKTYIVMTSGASGFPVGTTDLYVANPSFLPSIGSGNTVQYQQNWNMFFTPNDTSQTKSFGSAQREVDLVNRASDEGYNPNLYAVARPTIGYWMGAYPDVPGFVPGGGSAHNWNTDFAVFGVNGTVGNYDAFSVQQNALVGKGNDPSGHGGVGIDLFGSYTVLPSNPFTTSVGNSTITVSMGNSDGSLATIVNGDYVYIPKYYTVSGVTFGSGSYLISNISHTTHTFTITGVGNASAISAGGGTYPVISFSRLVPYAPEQFWGEFSHGIVTNPMSHFDSGYILETQAGNGIAWGDGSATSSVTTQDISQGNISVTINPTGSGGVGIGTTSPNYLLDVAGTGHFTGLVDAANFVATSSSATSLFNGNLTVNGNTTLTNATSSSFFATTASSTNLFAQTASLGSLSGAAFSSLSTNYLAKWNNGTWSNSLIFDNGTSVGIGTSTPGSIFSIGSANGINFSTATSTFSSTGGINLASGCFAVNGTCIGATNYFTNSGSNTWLSIGTNFGINNTSPGYALDVVGFINTDQNSGYKQAGNTVLYASTTNYTFATGASAAATWMAASSTQWYSVAIGQGALATAPTSGAAQYNLAVGYLALNKNTTGIGNTANGAGALGSNTMGAYNTANGFNVLQYNTTGGSNTANGASALNKNTTGSNNTANGLNALDNNTTGGANTANGAYSLYYNQSATSTVAIGAYAAQGAAFYSNQGGTAIGYQSGHSFATGSNYNTLLGYQTGYDITTGANNIVIGQEQTTGKGISTTSGNIFLGNDLQLATSTGNALNIGNLIFATGLGSGSTLSNGYVGIGTTSPYSKLEVWGTDTASTTAFSVVNNASTTVFASYDNGNATYSGSLFQSSDQRLKTNISSLDTSSSLSLVDQLNPVSYTRIDQPDQGTTLGFIAQEVQKLFPNLVTMTAATALTPGGTLTLNYTGLIAPLVAAVQALQNEIASIQGTIAGLAQSITTGTIYSQRDSTHQLCVATSNGGNVCITGDQLATLLAAANTSTPGGVTSGSSGASSTAPVIVVNGNNPAFIQVGIPYNDLGATITGPAGDTNLGIKTFLNGVLMSPLSVDTSQAATDTIDYVVTDQNGLTSTSTRTVVVQASAVSAISTNTGAVSSSSSTQDASSTATQ